MHSGSKVFKSFHLSIVVFSCFFQEIFEFYWIFQLQKCFQIKTWKTQKVLMTSSYQLHNSCPQWDQRSQKCPSLKCSPQWHQKFSSLVHSGTKDLKIVHFSCTVHSETKDLKISLSSNVVKIFQNLSYFVHFFQNFSDFFLIFFWFFSDFFWSFPIYSDFFQLFPFFPQFCIFSNFSVFLSKF